MFYVCSRLPATVLGERQVSECVEAALTAAVARAVRASESNVGFVAAEFFFQEAVCPATLTPLLMSCPEPGNGAAIG